MEIIRQKTLKSSIHCAGTGLHSGSRIALALHPAEAGTGIRFRRGRVEIPALHDHVVDTRLCTTLGDGHGTVVATVEHLMGALAGCGIDNAVIEVSGPEVPIMDGSAEPFVFLIDCAGIVEQDAPRRAIEIRRRVAVGDATRGVSLMPAPNAGGLSVSFEIEFESAAINRQEVFVPAAPAVFRREVSAARTFGFAHEVEQLRAAGLARGGSLENAVVISGDRVLNAEGLRFTNEFVRHKVLDCLGDLYLAGAPILGHAHGSRSGHAMNNRLLAALFADPRAWRMVPMTEAMATYGEREPAPAFA
jgi:UDP-3-O-[3-hydroxymyristoyl] N-acetylglucosamine deacetylase